VLLEQCGLAVGQSLSARHWTHPGGFVVPQATSVLASAGPPSLPLALPPLLLPLPPLLLPLPPLLLPLPALLPLPPPLLPVAPLFPPLALLLPLPPPSDEDALASLPGPRVVESPLQCAIAIAASTTEEKLKKILVNRMRAPFCGRERPHAQVTGVPQDGSRFETVQRGGSTLLACPCIFPVQTIFGPVFPQLLQPTNDWVAHVLHRIKSGAGVAHRVGQRGLSERERAAGVVDVGARPGDVRACHEQQGRRKPAGTVTLSIVSVAAEATPWSDAASSAGPPASAATPHSMRLAWLAIDSPPRSARSRTDSLSRLQRPPTARTSCESPRDNVANQPERGRETWLT
jgi:hypothetical protein